MTANKTSHSNKEGETAHHTFDALSMAVRRLGRPNMTRYLHCNLSSLLGSVYFHRSRCHHSRRHFVVVGSEGPARTAFSGCRGGCSNWYSRLQSWECRGNS